MIYHHIVAAYDGSEKAGLALKQAVQLAEKTPGAKLTVAFVQYRPVYAVEGFGVVTPPGFEDRINEYEQTVLKKAEDMIRDLPYKEVKVYTGSPAAAILECAEENNADLIVIGSRGLGTFKEMMLGSVSHYVAQHARVPVLIVK